MFTNSKLAKSVRLALAFGAAATALTANPSFANEEDEEEEVEKIEVTGSRIARSQIEGPQQLTVITAEDMSARGTLTVFDALTNLSQNGSFNFEGPEGAGFTPDVQTLNLRGLGVGNTLVLLNGRRAANYPGAHQASTSVFNFGSIPTAAVERIEVLSSGASAIYGSDAVAGVVNIILKKDIEDTYVDYMVSTPTESKDPIYSHRFQVITGKTFAKGNVTATLEYKKTAGIQAADFDKYDDQQDDYPYAARNGEAYRDRINLEGSFWNIYFGSYDDGQEGYADPGGQEACDALGNGTIYSFRPNRGNFCGYNSAKDTNFRNDREQLSGLVSANYELDNGIRLNADLLFGTSESRQQNGRSPYITEDILDFDNQVVVPNTGGFAYYDWVIRQRSFTGEELQTSFDNVFKDKNFTLTLGADGEIGDHYWRFNVTHSAYSMDSENPHWKAQEFMDVFLGEIAVDPIWGGIGLTGSTWYTGKGTWGIKDNVMTPVDDSNRDLILSALGVQTYTNDTSTTSVSFDISGDLFDLPAGPVSYAAVVEFEQQDFEFTPDELMKQDSPFPEVSGSGWWGLTGYQGKGDRERSALGFELRVPVLESLTANLAARVDSYDNVSSSIGTRTTPSLTVEWRPVDAFMMRAGYAESFRAPDMAMVYMETGFYQTNTDYVSCLQQHIAKDAANNRDNWVQADCEGSSTFVQRTSATNLDPNAKELEDETGETRWIGMSWDVTDNLALTIDYSEMELSNIVDTESVQSLFNDELLCYLADNFGETDNASATNCDYVSSRIERETNAETGLSYVANFNASPINQAGERLKLLDATVNYGVETKIGDLRFEASWSHTLEHEAQDNPGEEFYDIREVSWVPRSVLRGSFGWSQDDMGATLSFNRMGTTTVRNTSILERNDEGDIVELDRVDAWLRWNLAAFYNVNEDLTVALTVNNLFNEDAPKDSTIQPTQWPWYNTYVYAGAGVGREMSINATYRF